MSTLAAIRSHSGAKGMTIIELMIGAGMTSVVVLGLVVYISMAYEYFISVAEQARAIDSGMKAAYMITSTLSQAVNLRYETTIPIPTSADFGRIINYDSNIYFSGAVDVKTVAIFERDARTSFDMSASKRALPTGIFFQVPRAQKMGVLYIALGQAAGAAISPSYSEIFFDHIVEFQTTQIENGTGVALANGDGVVAVEFRIVVRNFWDTDRLKWRWCPSAQMGVSCPVLASYKDNEKIFRVVLRDNVVAGARPFKGVHFFKVLQMPLSL